MRKNLLILSILGVLALPAPALANSSSVVSECNSNGYLSHHYSRSDLQGALHGMGADVKEYTNCYDVIRRALDATAAGGAGHGGSGGGGAGGAGTAGGQAGVPGVSTDGVYGSRVHLAKSNHVTAAPVDLGDGAPISPGAATGFSAASPGNALPAPLLVVLAMLALAALAAGSVALRRRATLADGPGAQFTRSFRRVLRRSGG